MSDPVSGKFNEYGAGVPDHTTNIRPDAAQGNAPVSGQFNESGSAVPDPVTNIRPEAGDAARRASDPAKGGFVAGKFDLHTGEIPHARENISGVGAPGAKSS